MISIHAKKIFVLLALMLMSSCISTQTTHKIDVPEVDTDELNIRKLHAGESIKKDVLKFLGKPIVEFSWTEEFRKEAEVLGIEWFYPIRARADRAIPAPLMKMWFDSSGVLTDWGFFHYGTGQPLNIIESTEAAKQWYNSLCNPPTWLEIDKILKRNLTSKKDVLMSFQWWTPYWRNEKEMPIYYRQLIKPIQAMEDQIDTLIFYVDRPSPIFTPPFYVRLRFSNEIVEGWNIEGYGGCK